MICIYNYSFRAWILWGQEQTVEQLLRGGRGAGGQAGRRQADQQAGSDHLCGRLCCVPGNHDQQAGSQIIFAVIMMI